MLDRPFAVADPARGRARKRPSHMAARPGRYRPVEEDHGGAIIMLGEGQHLSVNGERHCVVMVAFEGGNGATLGLGGILLDLRAPALADAKHVPGSGM